MAPENAAEVVVDTCAVATAGMAMRATAPRMAAAVRFIRMLLRRLDEHAVVPVGAGDGDVEPQPGSVAEQVVLGAALGPVGGVGAGQLTPLSRGR
ncbi:hypothetical protein SAMN05660657_05663 [Geodermatophilus amargosae]|uniref:Uncharacterized protein n=1 Tax=Geodermatophilus amargosae TaxID=1296565 RepID=A0A1I7DDS1_9ACTN|nr:hypothetical protein SAMN05660657_05663 [Geodermatophilus amargosae]